MPRCRDGRARLAPRPPPRSGRALPSPAFAAAPLPELAVCRLHRARVMGVPARGCFTTQMNPGKVSRRFALAPPPHTDTWRTSTQAGSRGGRTASREFEPCQKPPCSRAENRARGSGPGARQAGLSTPRELGLAVPEALRAQRNRPRALPSRAGCRRVFATACLTGFTLASPLRRADFPAPHDGCPCHHQLQREEDVRHCR